MSDYQTRVKQEKQELDQKIESLRVFIFTEDFEKLPDTDQGLLIRQLRAMQDYSEILRQRIFNFT